MEKSLTEWRGDGAKVMGGRFAARPKAVRTALARNGRGTVTGTLLPGDKRFVAPLIGDGGGSAARASRTHTSAGPRRQLTKSAGARTGAGRTGAGAEARLRPCG